MSKEDRVSVRFKTEEFVASFPSNGTLREPDTKSAYPSGKFSVTLLGDVSENETTIANIKEAVDTVFAKAKLKDGDNNPYKNGIGKVEGKFKAEFKTKMPPVMTSADGKLLPEDVEINAGDIIRVAGTASTYTAGAERGVTLYLNHVRLIEKSVHLDPFDDGVVQITEPSESLGATDF